ncbi:MAG TPA: metalloregulator ArsR/SmtB family transcription factor [bacterium]
MKAQKLIVIFGALENPARLKIIKALIKKQELSCMKIKRLMHLSQPTISHHLKVLVNSDLLKVRKHMQFNYFSLNNRVIKMFLDELKKINKGR